MTHIPGHTGTDNTPALAGLDSDLSGQGGVTAYTNQVYLGTQKVPGFTAQSPTGATYTVKSRKTTKTLTTQEAKALYLTDPSVEKQWLQTLQRNGLPTDKIKARTLWNLSVDGASDWYATSNGTQQVTPEQYITWYAGGAKKKAKPDVARAVYDYAPEQIAEDVDKIAQKVLGRTINDADKTASWYSDLIGAIDNIAKQGTTTTVKDVRNPKTGKLERVTTQAPEFTTQAAAAKIESTLKNIAPEDAERKKRSDFMSWMFGQIGGGQ